VQLLPVQLALHVPLARQACVHVPPAQLKLQVAPVEHD
jgi:hypothetical protein